MFRQQRAAMKHGRDAPAPVISSRTRSSKDNITPDHFVSEFKQWYQQMVRTQPSRTTTKKKAGKKSRKKPGPQLVPTVASLSPLSHQKKDDNYIHQQNDTIFDAFESWYSQRMKNISNARKSGTSDWHEVLRAEEVWYPAANITPSPPTVYSRALLYLSRDCQLNTTTFEFFVCVLPVSSMHIYWLLAILLLASVIQLRLIYNVPTGVIYKHWAEMGVIVIVLALVLLMCLELMLHRGLAETVGGFVLDPADNGEISAYVTKVKRFMEYMDWYLLHPVEGEAGTPESIEGHSHIDSLFKKIEAMKRSFYNSQKYVVKTPFLKEFAYYESIHFHLFMMFWAFLALVVSATAAAKWPLGALLFGATMVCLAGVVTTSKALVLSACCTDPHNFMVNISKHLNLKSDEQMLASEYNRVCKTWFSNFEKQLEHFEKQYLITSLAIQRQLKKAEGQYERHYLDNILQFLIKVINNEVPLIRQILPPRCDFAFRGPGEVLNTTSTPPINYTELKLYAEPRERPLIKPYYDRDTRGPIYMPPKESVLSSICHRDSKLALVFFQMELMAAVGLILSIFLFITVFHMKPKRKKIDYEQMELDELEDVVEEIHKGARPPCDPCCLKRRRLGKNICCLKRTPKFTKWKKKIYKLLFGPEEEGEPPLCKDMRECQKPLVDKMYPRPVRPFLCRKFGCAKPKLPYCTWKEPEWMIPIQPNSYLEKMLEMENRAVCGQLPDQAIDYEQPVSTRWREKLPPDCSKLPYCMKRKCKKHDLPKCVKLKLSKIVEKKSPKSKKKRSNVCPNLPVCENSPLCKKFGCGKPIESELPICEEENAKKKKLLEMERRKLKEAEKKKLQDAQRIRSQEFEKERLEEAKRKELEESEKKKELEAERMKLQEAKKLKSQEYERKKKEETEKRKLEEAERKKLQEAERKKLEEDRRQKAQEKKIEEAERKKIQDAEKKKIQEAEKRRAQENRKRELEEAERRKPQEIARKKQQDAERRKAQEIERKKSEEAQKLKALEKESQKSQEADRREAITKRKLQEAERNKPKYSDRLLQELADQPVCSDSPEYYQPPCCANLPQCKIGTKCVKPKFIKCRKPQSSKCTKQKSQATGRWECAGADGRKPRYSDCEQQESAENMDQAVCSELPECFPPPDCANCNMPKSKITTKCVKPKLRKCVKPRPSKCTRRESQATERRECEGTARRKQKYSDHDLQELAECMDQAACAKKQSQHMQPANKSVKCKTSPLCLKHGCKNASRYTPKSTNCMGSDLSECTSRVLRIATSGNYYNSGYLRRQPKCHRQNRTKNKKQSSASPFRQKKELEKFDTINRKFSLKRWIISFRTQRNRTLTDRISSFKQSMGWPSELILKHSKENYNEHSKKLHKHCTQGTKTTFSKPRRKKYNDGKKHRRKTSSYHKTGGIYCVGEYQTNHRSKNHDKSEDFMTLLWINTKKFSKLRKFLNIKQKETQTKSSLMIYGSVYQQSSPKNFQSKSLLSFHSVSQTNNLIKITCSCNSAFKTKEIKFTELKANGRSSFKDLKSPEILHTRNISTHTSFGPGNCQYPEKFHSEYQNEKACLPQNYFSQNYESQEHIRGALAGPKHDEECNLESALFCSPKISRYANDKKTNDTELTIKYKRKSKLELSECELDYAINTRELPSTLCPANTSRIRLRGKKRNVVRKIYLKHVLVHNKSKRC